MTTLICDSFDPMLAVRTFMEKGGQSVDRFDARQITLYTGLQCEELAEKLLVIAGGALTSAGRGELLKVVEMLNDMSERFKSGMHLGDVLRSDHAALLDADIDLAWVSMGAAYSVSSDAPGAFTEVAKANHAKFPNGVPLRNAQGKIVKPEGWRSPDLEPFVARIEG